MSIAGLCTRALLVFALLVAGGGIERTVFAQDPGIRDSLRLNVLHFTTNVGDSVAVGVFLIADEAIDFASVALTYSNSQPAYELSSVAQGPLFPQGSGFFFATYANTSERTLAFSWAGLVPSLDNAVANPQETLFATLYFRILHQPYCWGALFIDTAFVPPTWRTELSAVGATVSHVPVINAFAYYCVGARDERDSNNSEVPFDMAIHPSPFNESVNIELQGQSSGLVAVDIMNLLGQRIRSLSFNNRQGEWDGRDAFSQRVASGVYFIRAQTETQQVTRKIVLLR